MEDLEQLYRCYARPVHRYLCGLCRDDGLAEELTAETFYRAVRAIGRYDGSCKLLTWLCQIAKNAYYDELRKRRRGADSETLAFLPDTAPGPAAAAEQRDELLALLRRMQALGGTEREAVYLRVMGGLSFREIGDVLGHTETWARVTFYRAKQKLKEGWEDHEAGL